MQKKMSLADFADERRKLFSENQRCLRETKTLLASLQKETKISPTASAENKKIKKNGLTN